jgi:hypothetical protein
MMPYIGVDREDYREGGWENDTMMDKWWQFVIDYPYKSSIEMSGYELTYRIYTSKFLAISIFMNSKKITLFLEFDSLHKKNNSPLLILLNICKLSYFIDYKCPSPL